MITEPNVESTADEDDKQQLPEDQPKSSTSSSSISHPTSSSSSNSQQQQQSSQCPTKKEPAQKQQQLTNVNPNHEDSGDLESTYHLKWIPWNSGKIPIVMQSINGPCPLIATMNVLLLREKVKLPQMLEQITATQLLTYIGECIMDSVSNPNELIAEHGENATGDDAENALLNLEQNIHDAMEILPKLKTGLDVNIRFTGITDFEYTPECIIFDLLRIPLYHGWLCDPNSLELTRAINTQSYNQLVDMIITNKTSQDPDRLLNVFIAEEFLENTASQLTLHGLEELRTKIKDNEIGILFRNNHFLTLFKRENVIYTLVTDHGYLTEDNIIWETLDNIEGAGRFMDSNFQSAETTNRQVSELNAIDQRQQQLENDFLMALSLKAEESMEQQQPQTQQHQAINSSDNIVTNNPEMSSTVVNLHDLDDFELAKRLQDEENQIYEEMLRARQTRAETDQRLALVVAEDLHQNRQQHPQQSPRTNISSSSRGAGPQTRETSLPIDISRQNELGTGSNLTYHDPDEFPPLSSTTSLGKKAQGDAQTFGSHAKSTEPQQQPIQSEPLPTSSNQIGDTARHSYRNDQPASTTIATSRSQNDLSAQNSYNNPHHQQQLRTTSASSNGGRRSRNERSTKDSNCSIS